MQPNIRDAIIATWQSQQETKKFKEIKQNLVNRGFINDTNDTSLTRWLKQLEKDGFIKKVNKGYYTLELHPKKYQIFDYLNELREKYGQYIWDGEVGSWISHLCASTYINFDDTLLKEQDEIEAFSVISTRIGELFATLYDLRNAILKRRCGLKELNLPDEVIREVFFGYLNMGMGDNLDTEELVKQNRNLLSDMWKSDFDRFYERNKWNADKSILENILIDEVFLEEIFQHVEGYKQDLKKELLDVDKFSEEELIEKYTQINKRIKKNHYGNKRTMKDQDFVSFVYTKQESKMESMWRTAVMVKVAEYIRALGTNLEDFAVVLTRHPSTMHRYYTPEHVLYDAMEWAKESPKDETLKVLWQEAKKREGGFDGMVASQLATTHFTVQQFKELSSKPWVMKELRQYGNFDNIIRLYIKKKQERAKKNTDVFKLERRKNNQG